MAEVGAWLPVGHLDPDDSIAMTFIFKYPTYCENTMDSFSASCLAIAVVFSLYILLFSTPPRGRIRPVNPPIGVLAMSICDMADALMEGNTTSVELVAAFSARIREVNPSINALVGLRLEQAELDAKLADQARIDGDKRRFLGVPLVVKECFEFPGLPYTAGMMSRIGVVGKVPGEAMQSIIDAGFVVLGCGNVSEACMWAESSNRVYGRSVHPLQPSHTPGGSSGGTAAAILAGMATAGIGSDVGGSIRIPASYCGICGHKPTGRSISNNRTHPLVEGDVENMCQLGPLSRHGEFVCALSRVIRMYCPQRTNMCLRLCVALTAESERVSVCAFYFAK